MSIGYDAAAVPTVSSVDDLLGPDFQSSVALTGDPTRSGAAAHAVLMTALARGGAVDDVAPGVEFFGELKAAGNFVAVDATTDTVLAGQTSVVLDWDYRNALITAQLPSWRVVVPEGVTLSGFYYQAINKDAPHPAAARLWQEFLYSDEAQNLWLAGGARPVRAEAMVEAGTIDQGAYAKLPVVTGPPIRPSVEDTTAVSEYLGAHWANAVG
jgi:putative spermidine/putrescine transport system substrate-binding protein